MSYNAIIGYGKIAATYKDTQQAVITEPLSYTKFNLADPAASITAYNEEYGITVTVPKENVVSAIYSVANGIAGLTQNTFNGVKATYEVKLTETT